MSQSNSSSPQVSIVIPVYRDYQALNRLLKQLVGAWKSKDFSYEVIIVDGKQNDDAGINVDTSQVIDSSLMTLSQISVMTHSPPQRAGQMNAGASKARGKLIWFVHADSKIPHKIDRVFEEFMNSERRWGRFNIWLDSTHPTLKLVAFMINWRSRISGICTGDQGIFIHKALFEALGQFPNQALMEDIELSKSLKVASEAPFIPPVKLGTSSRKWLKEGIWRTIFLMWRLRYSYWRGATPEQIHQRYYRR